MESKDPTSSRSTTGLSEIFYQDYNANVMHPRLPRQSVPLREHHQRFQLPQRRA